MPEPRFDYRCTTCGYGISVAALPPLCPMCKGAEWEDGLGRRATTANHRTPNLARDSGGGDGLSLPGAAG